MTEALFKYQIHVSPKARNIRLKVSMRQGLEVVIPQGYDKDKVPALLEKKKHWIREALDRAEANRKFFEPEPAWQLPHEINLPAIGFVGHVTVKETEASFVAVREIGEGRLIIFGAVQDQQACCAALGRWLIRQTRSYLIPQLHAVSIETRLRYKRCFVKRQKTRWASCSRHGTITLNAKLLFLPPHIVNYVMIHELCHLKEMNHSRQYWQLLAHHCPKYRKLDEQLREMWKVVPRWAV